MSYVYFVLNVCGTPFKVGRGRDVPPSPIAANPASSDRTPTPAGSSDRPFTRPTASTWWRACDNNDGTHGVPPSVRRADVRPASNHVETRRRPSACCRPSPLSPSTTTPVNDPNNDDGLGEREREGRPVGIRESHYCIGGVRLVFLIVRRLFPVDSGLTIIVCCPLHVQKKPVRINDIIIIIVCMYES